MPPAKKAAVSPQDHLKAEAQQRPLVFTHDGNKYTIERAQADNLELLEFIEDGKLISAMRAYLGPEQWAKWKDSVRLPDGRVPVEPLETFVNKVMQRIGGGTDDAPNSEASPTS